MIGPLVPSDTCRRYQLEAGRLAAKVPTEHAAWTGATTTRFERTSPFYLEVWPVVWGRWLQQRVSAGIATKAVTPTQASMASKSLFEKYQAASRLSINRVIATYTN